MAMLKRCGIIVAAVSAVYASGVVASSPSLSYSVSLNSSPFPSASVRLLSSDRLMTETWAAGQGLLRSTRAVYTFAVNTIDYKVSLMRYDPNSEEYYNTRDQVHMRTAKRILKLCETNRGFYIKAGQFIASMQHVPKEFVQTLSVLQDKASFWPFKLMEQVFQEEFGKSAEEM
jgi:aarF domain-containing kinase